MSSPHAVVAVTLVGDTHTLINAYGPFEYDEALYVERQLRDNSKPHQNVRVVPLNGWQPELERGS